MATAVLSPRGAFPSPAERPSADVVLYDGHCRFCLMSVGWLRWFDRGGRLAYLSVHDEETARRYPHISQAALLEEMYVIDRAGREHRGADAWRYLARRLPTLWPLALVMHIPFSMPLWRWVYRRIAKHRYLLFGKALTCEDGVCKLP